MCSRICTFPLNLIKHSWPKLKSPLRLAVKRVLKHAGYPPDAQKLAELRVMETAKAIAGELV